MKFKKGDLVERISNGLNQLPAKGAVCEVIHTTTYNWMRVKYQNYAINVWCDNFKLHVPTSLENI